MAFGNFKDDGVAMTFATSSKLAILKWGRLMEPQEALCLLGFPVKNYDLEGFSSNALWQLVGNTMCVGTIGTLSAVLLAILKPST